MPLSPRDVAAMYAGMGSVPTSVGGKVPGARGAQYRAPALPKCDKCGQKVQCVFTTILPGTKRPGDFCVWCWEEAAGPIEPPHVQQAFDL
jgi:hypothetical protein